MCVKDLVQMSEELNRVLRELAALVDSLESVKVEHDWSYRPVSEFASVDHTDYEIELSGSGPKVVSSARITIHVVDCCEKDAPQLPKVTRRLTRVGKILLEGP